MTKVLAVRQLTAVLRDWDLEVVVALEVHNRMEASKPDMGSSESALDNSAAFRPCSSDSVTLVVVRDIDN